MTAYELCWIWDRYCSVDIAAWVQAIGSVIAIGLSVWLYWHQLRTTAQEKKNDRAQRREHQLFTVKLYLNEIDMIFDEIIKESKETYGSKFLRVRYLGAKLEEASKWSRVLETDTFLGHELIKFKKIRNNAFDLANWINFTDNQFLFMSQDHYQSSRDKVANDIAYFQTVSV